MPHLGEFTKKKHASLTSQADLHPPKLHASSHESGEDDEISITGLSGELADAQTPKAHKTSHQKDGADEIDLSGLSGQQIYVPYNGKIADITHADTNKHTLDLATALSETRKIIVVSVSAPRIAGSGHLRAYPNEGSTGVVIGASWGTNPYNFEIIIADGTQRLEYDLTWADDDFDLYCLGYVVEA